MRNIIFISAALSVLPLLTSAQQNTNSVHIRIDANVDGKQINIDTTIADAEDFDVNEYLDELGLGDEMTQLDIDITDGTEMHFDFNQDALQEMINNIQNIEIPEMPEMPDMPALAPMENFTFSNGNKAFLGVMTESVEKNEGVRITEVIDSTAAAEAGLKEGDIITKIDDKTVESPNNLIEILSPYEPGDKVTITYTRDGSSKTVKASLQENHQFMDLSGLGTGLNELHDGLNRFGQQMQIWGDSMRNNFTYEEKGFLGVTIDDMDDADGVIITDIIEGGAAEAAGLKPGDRINTIDNVVMKNFNDVVNTIGAKKPGDVIRINYTHDGKTMDIDVTLKSGGSWSWSGDEEGMNWGAPVPPSPPGITIYSCPEPPVNAYCYSIKDGDKKNISMSIRIIHNGEGENAPASGENSTGAELDPETIQFFPNPTTGVFTLRFNLEQNGDTEVSVRDLAGNVVYSEELKGFEGSYEKTIDLGKAAKGAYFINIKQNDYTATKQIVLQ